MLNVACCNQPVHEKMELLHGPDHDQHLYTTVLSDLVRNYFLCLLETANVFCLLEVAKITDW